MQLLDKLKHRKFILLAATIPVLFFVIAYYVMFLESSPKVVNNELLTNTPTPTLETGEISTTESTYLQKVSSLRETKNYQGIVYPNPFSSPENRTFRENPPNTYYVVSYTDADYKQYISNLGGDIFYDGRDRIKVSTMSFTEFAESYANLLEEAFDRTNLNFSLKEVSNVPYSKISDSEYTPAYGDKETDLETIYVLKINGYTVATPRGVFYIKSFYNIEDGYYIVEMPKFFPLRTTLTKLQDGLVDENKPLKIISYDDPNFSTLVGLYQDDLDYTDFDLREADYGPLYVLDIGDNVLFPVFSILSFVINTEYSNLLNDSTVYFASF
jgi:hypothetical protein